MKKKLFYIFTLLVLAVPCCFALTGCGKDKNKMVAVVSQTSYECSIVKQNSFVNNGSTSPVHDYVDAGVEVTYDIVISDTIDADSLKVFANGVEISWTKNTSYQDDVFIESSNRQVVGSITVTPTEDTEFSVEYKEKTLEFNVKVKDDAVLTDAQKAVLSDFKFNNDRTILEMIEGNMSIGTNYSEIFYQNGLLLKSSKTIGYYINYDFFTNANLVGTWTQEKNEYHISSLMYNETTNQTEIKKQNTLIIDPEQLNVNTVSIRQDIGSMLELLSSDVNVYSVFRADANATIYIKLVEKAGFDLSNATVWINGTEIPKTGDAWILLTSKLPLDYLEYSGEDEIYSQNVLDCTSHYNIEVKNVVVQDTSNITKLVATTDVDEAQVVTNGYYYNTGNGEFYFEQQSDTQSEIAIDYAFYNNNTAQDYAGKYIVVTKNKDQANAVVINLSEHIEKGETTFTVDGCRVLINLNTENPTKLSNVTVFVNAEAGSTFTINFTNNAE